MDMPLRWQQKNKKKTACGPSYNTYSLTSDLYMSRRTHGVLDHCAADITCCVLAAISPLTASAIAWLTVPLLFNMCVRLVWYSVA